MRCFNCIMSVHTLFCLMLTFTRVQGTNVRPTDPYIILPSPVYESQEEEYLCRSDFGKPAPVLTWRFGKARLRGIQRNMQNNDSTVNSTNHLFLNLRLDDSGKVLKCDMRHVSSKKVKTATKHVKVIFVMSQPKIESAPFVEGENASVKCSIETVDTNVSLTLSLSGVRQLPPSSAHKEKTANGSWLIEITYSFVPDRSWNQNYPLFFVCTALNTINKESRHIIMVNVRPTDPYLITPDTTYEHQRSHYQCKSDFGNPSPILTWRLGNSRLLGRQINMPNNDSTINSTNHLYIKLNMNENGKELRCDMQHISFKKVKTATSVLTVISLGILNRKAKIGRTRSRLSSGIISLVVLPFVAVISAVLGLCIFSQYMKFQNKNRIKNVSETDEVIEKIVKKETNK